MAKKRPRSGANGATNGSPQPDACYFLSLTLRNVRCFGDEPQTLDLSDGKGNPARWTILLGNNGTGKTTVLQALAYLGVVWANTYSHPMSSTPGSTITPRQKLLMSNWHEFLRHEAWGSELAATFALVPTLAQGGGDERRAALRVTVAMPSIGFFAKPTPDEQRYAWDALRCYGYGASRRLSATNLAPDEPNAATASLFSDDAPLVNAEEWLLRLDYSASKESAVQDQQKKRLATVQRLLLDILPEDEVRDIRFTAPTTTHRDPRVEFQTPYGWVGLRQLGHGYRTLIAWMVDFASRLFDRAPDSPDPLATPAVALIDEIDLHLHPLWQRQLIGHLTKCFPNTQFVVTAHSPLIVQAAGEDANIVLLRREGDHVVIDNDHNAIHGWRVDQVLTSDLFGLPSARPPQLDDLFERREQILTKASLTEKDRKELAALEERIGQLPAGETTEQAEILARIDRNLQFLREQRTGK